jgi:CBS domain-containing protein
MTDISPKIQRTVAVVDENKTVFDAATVMVGKYIGSVVVTGSSAVKGIFTERDLMRIIAERKNPADVRLKDVMRTDLVSVHPNETVEQCLALMRTNRCRHLLVFEGEELAGIVSLRDLAALMLEEKEGLIGQLTKYITG